MIEVVERVEILTLQDNAVDFCASDDSAVVERFKGVSPALSFESSLAAEHGFSAVITVGAGKQAHSALFDFGFSARGAANNALALGADLSAIEALVLSHGHVDHFGGLLALAERVGPDGLELTAHPAAFRQDRHTRVSAELRIGMPSLQREALVAAGIRIVETAEPRGLLGGRLWFLGQVPRDEVGVPFEPPPPRDYHTDPRSGRAERDRVEDDSAVVARLGDRGLVIVTGCAHAGVVNTVRHAQRVSGEERIFALVGGFHLGPRPEAAVTATVEAIAALKPKHVVPTHCTGRRATRMFEEAMPEQFIYNMSGTKLIFRA